MGGGVASAELGGGAEAVDEEVEAAGVCGRGREEVEELEAAGLQDGTVKGMSSSARLAPPDGLVVYNGRAQVVTGQAGTSAGALTSVKYVVSV